MPTTHSDYNIILNDYFINFTNNPADQDTIIIGDFNVPLNHNNSKATEFIKILYLLGHHHHVHCPTHQHENILDLIITTNDFTLITDINIATNTISGDFTLNCTLTFTKTIPKLTNIIYRKLN